MQIIYALEEFPKKLNKSLMIAGPTPRTKEVESWRKDAIKILEDIGFDGAVFVPEPRDGNFTSDYDAQVEWEEQCLNAADCIIFWVPRNLETLPGFTTNVEFGRWENSGKIVFGCPEDAEKVSYLKYYCDKYKVDIANTLTETINNALEYLGDGAERKDSECQIPLLIWKLDSFQQWYKSQTDAGNLLHSAKLLFTFRPNDKPFLWVLHAEMYIKSEDRYKTNEFVLSRTDISTIVLWKKSEPIEESEVVLVKEYRVPAATSDGFVLELVGGSSNKKEDPIDIAVEEILEETGFVIKSSRLKQNQTRQLAATLSAHKSHLYFAELDDEELKYFKSKKGVIFGKQEDTERTYIEVYTVKDILENQNIDWTTVGQILSIIFNN